MCIKRTIKELGRFGMLPLFFTLIVMPYIMYYCKEIYQDEYLVRQIMLVINQVIIPVIALCWPFALLAESVSGTGNELLFIKNRNKLVIILVASFIYFALLIPYFLYYQKILNYTSKEVGLQYIKIIIGGLLLISILYFISFATGSINIASAIVILYIILCTFSGSKSEVWNYYNGITKSRYYGFVCIIIFLYGVGYILNRKYEKYT